MATTQLDKILDDILAETAARAGAPAVGMLAVAALVVGPGEVAAQTPHAFDRGGEAGPVADSARVVGSNPSAMGLVDGVALDLDHSLQLRSQSVEMDGERADNFVTQSNPGVAFVSDLGTERFRVGFDGGLPRRYGSAWPSGGPQRYDSIFHRTRGIHLTAAGAFSPVDWLHLGGSVRFVQAEYRSYRAVDMGRVVARQEGVDPETVPQRQAGNEGREYLDFSGRTFGWSAGVTATPGPFRVGAAYHGPVPVDVEGSYELYVPRNEYYQDRYGGDVNRDATLETSWPGRLELGGVYAFGAEGEVFADVGWTMWQTVDRVAVDVAEEGEYSFDRREARNLDDTFELRVGGVFRPTDWLAVDGTLGGETSALPPERLTAEVVDRPKLLAGVGAEWKIADGVDLRTGYQHVHYFGTETSPDAASRGTPGQYRQTLGIVETSLGFHFDP